MVPPARMTAFASETISWKWVEGSRRRYLSVIRSGSEGVEDLLKKRRPSFEEWVSADSNEATWWRTGVDDVWGFCPLTLGAWAWVSEVSLWTRYPSTLRAILLSWRYRSSLNRFIWSTAFPASSSLSETIPSTC